VIQRPAAAYREAAAANLHELADASAPSESTVSVERLTDCPFSLAVDAAPTILPLFATPDGALRVPYRALGLPFPGALTHRVAMYFRTQRDASEPGRVHDEVLFDWSAQSRGLPDFHGVLRFRIASSQTRIILSGGYVPPFGALGAAFDRFIGRRLARATADDLVNRLGRALEARWVSEQ
jgi:hypothetical protein